MLLADAEKRHGEILGRVRRPETDYYPSYDNYEELVQEVSRVVFWYGDLMRSRPIRRVELPREDGDQNGENRYPCRTTPLLRAKSIDVLRRMPLLQNARHYMSHILIANDVYMKQADSDGVIPDDPVRSTEGSGSIDPESDRSTDPPDDVPCH